MKSIFKHKNSIKYPELNIKWGQKYTFIIDLHQTPFGLCIYNFLWSCWSVQLQKTTR